MPLSKGKLTYEEALKRTEEAQMLYTKGYGKESEYLSLVRRALADKVKEEESEEIDLTKFNTAERLLRLNHD